MSRAMTSTQHMPRPQPLTLEPGQSLWMCLLPGSTLHATHGEVAVRWSPATCGQTWHTPPLTRLRAGEQLLGNDQRQPVWVQLHNPQPAAATIQLTEVAPTPGFLETLWCSLRAVLSSAKKSARGPGDHGGWNTAR